MVFLNEYALDYDQSVYSHFIRKFVYDQVLSRYWVPITVISCLLIVINVTFIVWFVNLRVLRPIQVMSNMTEFILNPDDKEKNKNKIENQFN